jgi:hypothetical protein
MAVVAHAVYVHGVRPCLRTAATNRPIVHPPHYINIYPRWNVTDRGKLTPRKTRTSAILCTINPAWTKLEANSGHRSDMPATKRLSYGTAFS